MHRFQQQFKSINTIMLKTKVSKNYNFQINLYKFTSKSSNVTFLFLKCEYSTKFNPTQALDT